MTCDVWRVTIQAFLPFCSTLTLLPEAALAEAKKKANMVLPASSIAAGHVITQCNTGRMPDGSAAVVVK